MEEKRLETVYIEKIAYGGSSIGKLPGGKLVLVEGGYPGELLRVKVNQEKSDVAFGVVEEILEPSKERVKPRCKYFGICGGCHFMDVNYKYQLKLKKDIVEDQLRRIAKLEVPVNDVIESELEFEYRNKMEFQFSFKEKAILGLNMRKSNKVVPLEECPISPKVFSKALKEVPELVNHFKVRIYNPKTQTGTLKHLVMRYSHSHNETMAIFVTKTERFNEMKDIKTLLLREIPQISSIIHVMNSSDSIVLRGPYKTVYGEGVLDVEFDYEKFQIPPTAFFQNNYFVAKKMVDYVTKTLELNGNETVLDLYAGLGTFSLRLAMLSKHVTAVESSHISVKAGRANANINQLRNIKFEEADVLEFLKSYNGKPNVIVMDPPRAGAGEDVVKEILRLEPEKISYVSCDPSTLARDLNLLKDSYEILSVQPFDMFPQTYHVETVVILKKK